MGEALVGDVPQGEENREGSRIMERAETKMDIGAAVRTDSKLPFNGAKQWAAIVLAAMGLAFPAAAQVKANATATDVAAYGGADRQQKLVEGAKKEGELSIYTSAQSDDMGALVAAFEKKYGIKVSVWRSSSEKVLQRAVTEAQANRHTMDVAETNGPELESMHREKILEAVKSPFLADLIAPAIRPHGEWVGTRLNVFVQAYNTGLVKKDELPKTWEDLANPKWKGKLGIET